MRKKINIAIAWLLVMLVSLLLPLYPEAGVIRTDVSGSSDSQESFLSWYAEHKDTGGEYTLDGELKLTTGTPDKPIILDGTGEIDINCDWNSLFIQSEVIIDNKNLTIYSRNYSSSVVILSNESGEANARLVLKNGTIWGKGTAGLYFSSGELICPQGRDRFTIFSGGDSATALTVMPPNVFLSNLDITASGTGDVTGIIGGEQLDLQNCTVSANVFWEDNGKATGMKAEKSVSLRRTSVIVQGKNVQSVFCAAGSDQIKVTSDCTLKPELETLPQSDAQYRVTAISNPEAINVPIGISASELSLPEALKCQMTYLDGRIDSIPSRTISVNWDTDNLAARLEEEGECIIYGSFSENQLKEEHIYVPQSVRPTIMVRVIPTTAMNRIWIAQIELNDTAPFVEIYMQRPHGAESLIIEYSNDGVLWEPGFCICGKRESNILLYDTLQKTTLMVPVYLPEIAYGGRIRAVVTGGPFDGIWESVIIDPNNLFTRPGEDDKGGDRGGAQNQPDRETEHTESAVTGVLQPDTGALQSNTDVSQLDSDSDASAKASIADSTAGTDLSIGSTEEGYMSVAGGVETGTSGAGAVAIVSVTAILILCILSAGLLAYQFTKKPPE